jgi:hypothetical protein
VTGGAANILATAAGAATKADSSWDMILFVLGAGVNAVLLGINVIWTLAAKRDDRAEANEERAERAEMATVLEAIKGVRTSVDEAINGVQVSVGQIAMRLDKHDHEIDKLRERDREIEMRQVNEYAHLNANIEAATRALREAREEAKRG